MLKNCNNIFHIETNLIFIFHENNEPKVIQTIYLLGVVILVKLF